MWAKDGGAELARQLSFDTLSITVESYQACEAFRLGGRSGTQGLSLFLSSVAAATRRSSSATERSARRSALAEGGSITMSLAKTFWFARFGMLTDRFGLGWMVSVAS